MHLKRFVPVLILLVILLSACNGLPGGTNVAPNTSSAATPPAEPESGKATVVGRIMSRQTGQPMSNIVVRLAEVYREGGEGAYVLDGAFSPGDTTDEQGYFIMESIDAREYVVMVGDVYSVYEIIPNPDGRARVYEALPGDILDLGELTVDLEQP